MVLPKKMIPAFRKVATESKNGQTKAKKDWGDIFAYSMDALT